MTESMEPDEPSGRNPQRHHGEGSQVAQPHIGSLAGVRVDEAAVDVVDQVRRGGVHGGREIGHEGRQQAGHRYAQQARRNEPRERVGQHHLEIHPASHGADSVAVEHQGEDGESRDHKIAGHVQHHVHQGAHHAGLAWRPRGENPLHVVVGRRSGRAEQDALEQNHHEEGPENGVAVLHNLPVDRGNQVAPVQVQMPAEPDLVPARRHNLGEGRRRHARNGDDADGHRSHREYAELQHLGDDHAEHAALHHVEGGDSHEDQRVLVGGKMPGQEVRGELADALEAIGEKADDAHQRKITTIRCENRARSRLPKRVVSTRPRSLRWSAATRRRDRPSGKPG